MAKLEIKHIDFIDEKDFIKAEVYDDMVRICGTDQNNHFAIYLDKSTAIRFAKTVRTEINKIQ